MDAAETHGLLCGLLGSPHFNESHLFKYILGETAAADSLSEACQQQLLLLKNYTLSQLNSPTCEFMLLLPDDEEPLAERIQALGGWCEGFLFGLGHAHLPKLSTQVLEFIQDVIAISRIAPLANETEEEETNFTQLVEYLKIGVLTWYQELHLPTQENHG